MDFNAIAIFVAVADERSFSRAAAKLHRTQPAVSQAIRRLERDIGRELFDRSTKVPKLTDAGDVLFNYGHRLARLVDETDAAIRGLRDLRSGRILIGSNEAAVHVLLPLIGGFHQKYPDIVVDVRRVPARQIAVEVQQGSLDFGVLTFEPAEGGLSTVSLGTDELVLLLPPAHPLTKRRRVRIEEVAVERVIAHNEPSPARERVLRLVKETHVTLNMIIELPSLDGIKRAVEHGMGVALMPRRCAVAELASGRLVAKSVVGLSRQREVRLVCRPSHRSLAADAFFAFAGDFVTADPKTTQKVQLRPDESGETRMRDTRARGKLEKAY